MTANKKTPKSLEVKPLSELEALDKERVENPVAAAYRQAQEIVFNNLINGKDRLGRSLAWKVDAIKEDLAAKKDNDYTKYFVDEVSRIAEKMISNLEAKQ